MNYQQRRETLAMMLEEQAIAILSAGNALHESEDNYFPFSVHHGFYYLTGLSRENMILVICREKDHMEECLYIEEPIPSVEKWVGKKMTKQEAMTISGIKNVYYLDEFNLQTICEDRSITMYFDLYKHQKEDQDDVNLSLAKRLNCDLQYQVKDIHPLLTKLRYQKDENEIQKIQKAIDITEHALNRVMDTLKPGMMEYQVQAEFEYALMNHGASPAFTTIAGAGYNGTMLHYHSNQDMCQDGDLILLDLGAKKDHYCADITRTYPINGRFSDRQKQIYQLVLKANKAVIDHAKAGVTLNQLNQLTKEILSQGLIELGLIQNKDELPKYYMHSVSHPLGLDVHDVSLGRDEPLLEGTVITDEPGLYIEEEGIGIRIEDDLLIQKDGCVVLSEGIIKEIEDIENYMNQKSLS